LEKAEKSLVYLVEGKASQNSEFDSCVCHSRCNLGCAVNPCVPDFLSCLQSVNNSLA